MPEGDAVRRTARRLDAALVGGPLVRAELRVPRFATVELRGMQVLGTWVVGKHLLTRMIDDRREWTLHHHLRMDGAWRTGAPGPPGAPGHQVRVWLATSSRQAVGVRVHDVEVRPTREEAHWVGHLGPDILADRFDPEAAAEILGLADRPLVEALLDQRLVCGMGTIWASELAWAAGADPWAATSTVSRLGESLSAIRSRMLRAVEAAPPVTRRKLRVYERTGQPCRTCGTPIRAGRVGVAPRDRPTYWCPKCQVGIR